LIALQRDRFLKWNVDTYTIMDKKYWDFPENRL